MDLGESDTTADEVGNVWRDDIINDNAADAGAGDADAAHLSRELRLMEGHYEAELHIQRREKAELRMQVEGLQMEAFKSQTLASELQK